MTQMIFVFIEGFGLAAGCEDYGLADSRGTWIKGLKNSCACGEEVPLEDESWLLVRQQLHLQYTNTNTLDCYCNSVCSSSVSE